VNHVDAAMSGMSVSGQPAPQWAPQGPGQARPFQRIPFSKYSY
jgi:hypothetical protein